MYLSIINRNLGTNLTIVITAVEIYHKVLKGILGIL